MPRPFSQHVLRVDELPALRDAVNDMLISNGRTGEVIGHASVELGESYDITMGKR